VPVLSAEVAVRCPECGAIDTKVTSIKWNEKGTRVRRYRKCNECGHKFRTTQARELVDNCGRLFKATALAPPDPLFGEDNQNAVFTERNIRDMRMEYASGKFSQRALAQKYGVHQSTVCDIVNRKTWAHVE